MKDFGLRKQLNAIRKAKRAILVGAWKTIVLRAMWSMEAQFEMFQRGTKLAIGLETILVIFWQRTWLPFAHVLRICLRIN